jgi:hypothetical protein
MNGPKYQLLRNISSYDVIYTSLHGDELTEGKAVPWLRRLVAGLPPRRPGFDPGLIHVGFVVDKVTLGQVFLRVLRFSPVNFIPPVLHYYERDKKITVIIIVIIGLHKKPQGSGASVASAAGPFTTKKN